MAVLTICVTAPEGCQHGTHTEWDAATVTHEVPTQTVHTGTLAIPTVSQAQHVMTKLLKSKDRGLFCCILALTLCLGVLVYFVFFV